MWWAELLDGERLTTSTYDTGKMPCLVVSGIFPSYQFWSTCLSTITLSPYTHATHPKYTQILNCDTALLYYLCDHSIFTIIKLVQWLWFQEKWDPSQKKQVQAFSPFTSVSAVLQVCDPHLLLSSTVSLLIQQLGFKAGNVFIHIKHIITAWWEPCNWWFSCN